MLDLLKSSGDKQLLSSIIAKSFMVHLSPGFQLKSGLYAYMFYI